MKKLLYILLFVPLFGFGQSLPQVGDYYQGGIVFHVDSSENSGLIVLEEEFVGDYKWGCVDYQMPGAFYSDIGKGKSNSIQIQENCIDTLQYYSDGTTELSQNAANACLNFIHLQYDDWFLPSYDELQLIYDLFGQEFVSQFGYNLQSSNAYYWSSTQNDEEDSWGVYFYNGEALSSGHYGKQNQIEVRPVREFNLYGCKDELAVNFDLLAEYVDNSLCNYSSDSYQLVSSDAISAVSSLQQALDTWNTTIDLSEGWNMFGYGCPTSIDVAEGLSNHTESIAIVKDNNGAVYLPEWDFNGIGDFTPGFGYQIKVTEAIEGFSLCDWYVNDIPEDNIVSLQDSLQLINSQIGCTDSLACNYDVNKLYDDGSCEYPEPGYNCEGNINIQLGDEAFGGIVFYLDETGEFGLVASGQDLHEVGGTELEEGSFGYEWGCSNINKSWSNGYSIGTGYQNTINIVNEGCVSSNGGITAAQAATNFVYEGFNDWYLPSIDELSMMMNFLGIAEDMGLFYVPPYGSFANEWYQSSTYKEGSDDIWQYQEYMNTGSCDGPTRVRAIRSFGNWTMGCMDSLACNFNPEANMADGSCTYPEQGYDCDGIFSPEIGDLVEGGIVFYIDESGQHGLVAAIEDIEGTYEWGCMSTSVEGADGTSIGTGYQNTIDIVNQGCSTNNGGITAAQAALDAEINGYSDWYLPSSDELVEMYNTIGNGGPDGNISGFATSNPYYWSSSEFSSSHAWVIGLYYGGAYVEGKGNTFRVRPIRSF